MPKRVVITLCVSLILLGCPPASELPLAGDSRLVGTWEGNNILLGYHVFSRSTTDAEGNYTKFIRVQEDGSTATAGGKWYADPVRGYLDSLVEWTLPNTPEAEGVGKSLYEVSGNTLESWSNAVGMARPQNKESAMTHMVSTRVTSKAAGFELEEVGLPGVAQQLIDYLH